MVIFGLTRFVGLLHSRACGSIAQCVAPMISPFTTADCHFAVTRLAPTHYLDVYCCVSVRRGYHNQDDWLLAYQEYARLLIRRLGGPSV